MKLVIANKAYSSWSLRPWILMKVLDIPFTEDLIPLDTPEFRPRVDAYGAGATVPILVDGDVVMWESHAIMRYLTRRYDTNHAILPVDEVAIAQADKWLDWVHTVAWPALKPVFWGLVRTPVDKRNQDEIAAGVAACAKAYALVDQVLAHQAYLGGDEFTFGDIPMALIAHRWFLMPIENRPAMPHFKHWYDGIVARPGFARYGALPLS